MTHRYRKPRSPRAAMGDTWDTVKSLSAGIDPYLPEALCRVDQIRALRKDRSPLEAMLGKGPTVPVPSCYEVAPGQSGIGVEKALKPLRAGVYVYEHPIVVWLGATAVLAVPMLIGYMLGRRTKG